MGIRAIIKELAGAFVLLILAYLLLVHSTGFARDISALGANGARLAKTFQGR